MRDITVFTTGPSCQKCRLTKKRLAQYGLPFTEVVIQPGSEVERTILRLADAGEISRVMPVVHDPVSDMFWSDFRPAQIEELAALWRAEAVDLAPPGVMAA